MSSFGFYLLVGNVVVVAKNDSALLIFKGADLLADQTLFATRGSPK